MARYPTRPAYQPLVDAESSGDASDLVKPFNDSAPSHWPLRISLSLNLVFFGTIILLIAAGRTISCETSYGKPDTRVFDTESDHTQRD